MNDMYLCIIAMNNALIDRFLLLSNETFEQRQAREQREAAEWEQVKKYFEYTTIYNGEEKVFYHN